MPSSAGQNFAPEPALDPLVAGYRARSGRLDDAFGLRAVELRSIRMDAGRHYHPVIARSWARGATLDHYRDALRGGAVFEVAVDLVGHIVGFVQWRQATIEALYVEPLVMRRGIGSALLVRTERAMRALGHRHIEVEAPIGAVKFLMRRGYRTMATRERPTRGGFLMLLTRMSRELT